jgi:hypothetical protein
MVLSEGYEKLGRCVQSGHPALGSKIRGVVSKIADQEAQVKDENSAIEREEKNGQNVSREIEKHQEKGMYL